ncbi:DUF928 domain-containing protein [Oscillatoria acuminata]|uniref:DUF928 domain-containing protein n=1 Tax=Oscillatoria acuminata PCC 6304 TaxID=56110 RepID=K9TPC9_9CYAN|nr:DUF928 domain-containing protein [Oscillatoria acuminata]AFY83849.1 protein of unknown function (DUF928) [Oscillatoria acuminata PCC 6304]
MKTSSSGNRFGFMFLSLFMIMINLPIQVLSNENNQNSPFRGRGRPSNVIGGGSRGNCEVTAEHQTLRLTALVPAEIGGVTQRERPTWWFYSPFNQRVYSPLQAQFIVTKDDKNFLPPIDVTLPEIPGFFPVSIPPDSPLEVNKWYMWTLLVICDPQDESKHIDINGWIKRIPEHEDSEEYLRWYDPLDSIAQTQCDNPDDREALQQWEERLSSVEDQLEPWDQKVWKEVRDQRMVCHRDLN